MTPQLRSTLQAGGLLSIPNAGPQDQPIITKAKAVALATGFMRTFGPYILTELERAHGGRIEISGLTAAERVFFAETPDPPLPSYAATPYRKAYGPYYLVTFVDRAASPVVSVAVSAYNHDVDIRDDGTIRLPLHHGNEFMWHGIRLGRELPLSPEAAIRLVYEQTGVRVASVPVLVKPRTRTLSPHYARWRVELEQPIQLSTRSGASVSTRAVFVGALQRLLTAGPQGDHLVMFSDTSFRTHALTLPRRRDLPASFIEARE